MGVMGVWGEYGGRGNQLYKSLKLWQSVVAF